MRLAIQSIAITTKQNDKALKLLDRLNLIKIEDLKDDQIKYELTIKVQ